MSKLYAPIATCKTVSNEVLTCTRQNGFQERHFIQVFTKRKLELQIVNTCDKYFLRK